jgi:hypothetical protein
VDCEKNLLKIANRNVVWWNKNVKTRFQEESDALVEEGK